MPKARGRYWDLRGGFLSRFIGEDSTMVSMELLNMLRELNRAEKLHVIQLLVSELALEETELLQPGLGYPIWSPSDAVEAADSMLKVLNPTEPNGHA